MNHGTVRSQEPQEKHQEEYVCQGGCSFSSDGRDEQEPEDEPEVETEDESKDKNEDRDRVLYS